VNERCECGEFLGFTPLQLLAAIVVDTDSSAELSQSKKDIIGRAVNVLIMAGAHVDVPPDVPKSRPRKIALESNSLIVSSLPRHVNLRNKNVINLLGGKERLEAALVRRANMENLTLSGNYLSKEDSYVNCRSPGGNDENSCAICWKEFGMLYNRSKVCRGSMKLVCTECSSKRLLSGCDDYRISDGHFNRVFAQCVREDVRKKEILERRKISIREERNRAYVEEERSRQGLFGSVFKSGKGAENEQTQNVHSSVDGLSSQLHQTRDALLERGEKLQSVSDKSEALRDQSQEFARLAKQLNERSKGGFFF